MHLVFSDVNDVIVAPVDISFRKNTSVISLSIINNEAVLSIGGIEILESQCNFPAILPLDFLIIYDETGIAVGPQDSICTLPFTDEILESDSLGVIFGYSTDTSSGKDNCKMCLFHCTKLKRYYSINTLMQQEQYHCV